MTAVTDLLDFINARLDDDERVARAVEGIRMPWYFDYIDDAARPFVELALDPARVLREVEAHRALIAAFLQLDAQGLQPGGKVFGYHATGMLVALKHLATVYSNHPDYDESWRP